MKIAIIILFCFLTFDSIAQQEFQLKISPVNRDVMGNSLRMDIKLQQRKHAFYIGAGFLINPGRKERYPGAVYVHKAYANNLFQHFTGTVGYERYIKFKNGRVAIFPFTEFTIAKTGHKNESYIILGRMDNGYIVNTYNFISQDLTVFWLINHTGLGTQIQLTNDLLFSQQVSLSPAYIKDTYVDKKTGWKYSQEDLEGFIVPYYSIGLTYRL